MPQNYGDAHRGAASTPPGMPRWVKLFGIIALVMVLLLIILHLTGNSPGGPGNHTLPSSRIKHELQYL